MSKQSLEGLRDTHDRMNRATFLPEGQIHAVQNLVTAAHDQLVAHQIDRDATLTEEGGSIVRHRFDAYLQTQSREAIIKLSSVGLPDEMSTYGLFVEMYADLGRGMTEIVNIQTAKVPKAVKTQEALWLSMYRPEQLDLIADFIKNARPIDKLRFDNLLGRRQSLPPSDADIDRMMI